MLFIVCAWIQIAYMGKQETRDGCNTALYLADISISLLHLHQIYHSCIKVLLIKCFTLLLL